MTVARETQEIETIIEVETAGAQGHLDTETLDHLVETWRLILIPQVETTERANARTDTQEGMAEKREAGIEIEAIGAIGVTEEWLDGRLVVTMMTGRLDGTEICLRVVIAAAPVVVVVAVVLMTEVTVTNSQCRWELVIGTRALVRRQKRRSPPPDLTDTTPVSERKRRLTQWDIKPPGYENVTAEQAKLSGKSSQMVSIVLMFSS